MTVKKIIFGTISIIILTVIFTLLNSGGEIEQINQILITFLLALAAVVSVIIPSIKRLILLTAMSLLSVMILTYLFNLIDVANWLGSLGFGILLVLSCTYLPDFIKKGYIEKF